MPVSGNGPSGGSSGAFASGKVVWAERPQTRPVNVPVQRQVLADPQIAVQWTPAGHANLKGWYQADLLTGADGDEKTAWADSSGTGNDGSVSGFFGPLLRISALAGKNVLEFVASSVRAILLPSGMVSAFTEGSVFFVAKRSIDPPSSIGAIIGGTSTSGLNDHFPFTDGNIYDGFLSTTRKTVGDPGDLAQWFIGSFRSKASDYRYAHNGADFYTTATNTTGPASGAVYIGRNAGGDYLDANIAEIVAFDSFLSEGDRQNVEGYLAWKWGLVDRLPDTHPYKFAAPTLATVQYTLTADAATFTLSGQSAAFAVQRRIIASAGVYSITGQAAGINAQRRLTASAGAYVLTGPSAGLGTRHTLTASAGSFIISGQSANFNAQRRLTLSAGAFTLTAQAANLKAQRLLTASAGSYVLSGQSATLLYARTLSLAAGSYVLSGQTASLAVQRRLTLSAGVFAISGQSASLRVQRPFLALPGFYFLVGQDAQLVWLRGVFFPAHAPPLVVLGPATVPDAPPEFDALPAPAPPAQFVPAPDPPLVTI